jgi:hypothetical protein
MNTSEAIGFFGVILMCCLVLAGAIGWVLNIVEIAHATQFHGMVVLRAIGVFIPPLGAVLGYV